jgi:hypothetical protein
MMKGSPSAAPSGPIHPSRAREALFNASYLLASSVVIHRAANNLERDISASHQ